WTKSTPNYPQCSNIHIQLTQSTTRCTTRSMTQSVAWRCITARSSARKTGLVAETSLGWPEHPSSQSTRVWIAQCLDHEQTLGLAWDRLCVRARAPSLRCCVRQVRLRRDKRAIPVVTATLALEASQSLYTCQKKPKAKCLHRY
ncbi:hypothetical protein GGH97_004448, partial [Coemansia sp. RSA 475]